MRQSVLIHEKAKTFTKMTAQHSLSGNLFNEPVCETLLLLDILRIVVVVIIIIVNKTNDFSDFNLQIHQNISVI